MATERLKFEFDGDASKFNQAIRQSNKSVDNFSSNLTKVGGIIAGAFAIDKIMEFGGAVVETTSTFQRFESVLTNTLGSTSEAQKALDRITEFASQTPFSVSELTDSFVRLANQGFKPTSDEMRKLGDLASSTGKEFVQLTEAIIDAQVGEFERLKEFGIRASKQGDQVTFTFKNVKTQVDFTSDAIQNYILSLGDLEGVSGAMVGISKTLGGQISNLGDSFDSLKNEIGEALMPILTSAINGFKSLFESITRLLNPQQALLNDFKATKKELDEMNKSTEKLSGNDLKLFNLRKKLLEQKYVDLEKQIAVEIENAKDAIIEEQKEFSKLVESRNQLTTILENQTKEWGENNSEVKKSEKRALDATIAVDKQKTKIMEVTLALETLRTSYENIVNPVEETKEVFTQSESAYNGFTLTTQKLAEATSNFSMEAEIAKLKTREMLEGVKPSALGAMADGFKNIAMTVGLSFAQMAMQGEKSIKQIINSLAKMIVQMSIALVIGTVLKSLFDPSATAMTAKNLAVAGGIIAGAGILALATGGAEPQGFAKGGIITKPVMGMIGEAGQSEAVIPLNRLPQMVGAISGNQRGEFTLRGQDLILALERAGDFRARITG
tara:strand:- start:581 stop:2413 length:1833 start_codon:yes stop_codon:yes gene_type:complete